jgi:hypothetical protein
MFATLNRELNDPQSSLSKLHCTVNEFLPFDFEMRSNFSPAFRSMPFVFVLISDFRFKLITCHSAEYVNAYRMRSLCFMYVCAYVVHVVA